jgi:hypothetical protein
LLALRFFAFYETGLTCRAKQGHDGIMVAGAVGRR